MKILNLILLLTITWSVTACGQKSNAPVLSENNPSKTKIAEDFIRKYLTVQKTGNAYEFKDEAIDPIKNSLTPEAQQQVYQQLKSQFGDFQELEYAETWLTPAPNAMHIIRFKCDYDGTNKKLEGRVVIDQNNKIAGFWIKPWSDILK